MPYFLTVTSVRFSLSSNCQDLPGVVLHLLLLPSSGVVCAAEASPPVTGKYKESRFSKVQTPTPAF